MTFFYILPKINISDGITTDFSFMILQWKNAFFFWAFSTWEVMLWEEITKDNFYLVASQKNDCTQKGALH